MPSSRPTTRRRHRAHRALVLAVAIGTLALGTLVAGPSASAATCNPLAAALGLCKPTTTTTTTRPPATTTTARPTTTTTRATTTTAAPATTVAPTTTTSPTTTTTTGPGVPGHPFPASFWTTPLPATTPANPAGAGYGASIARQIRENYGHADLNVDSFAPNVYTVPAGAPKVDVAAWDCLGSGYLDPGFVQQMRQVPIPANVVPPADSDGHVVLWQPSTDTMWELWKGERTATGWRACWGGRLTAVSTSPGVFPNPYGATASGLALLGGLVRVDEVRAGAIRHVIAINLPEIRTGVFSYPANRTDGRKNSTTAIAEGQRLRLDPAIDLDALGLPPITKMIAKAMQDYGVIVRDGSGSVDVSAESTAPYLAAGLPDPYAPYEGGTPSWALLDELPWDRLVALPFDYGKP